jgi:hypothetical protein
MEEHLLGDYMEKMFHTHMRLGCDTKVEEPIPDTLRFRTTKESELDMNFF